MNSWNNFIYCPVWSCFGLTLTYLEPCIVLFTYIICNVLHYHIILCMEYGNVYFQHSISVICSHKLWVLCPTQPNTCTLWILFLSKFYFCQHKRKMCLFSLYQPAYHHNSSQQSWSVCNFTLLRYLWLKSDFLQKSREFIIISKVLIKYGC